MTPSLYGFAEMELRLKAVNYTYEVNAVFVSVFGQDGLFLRGFELHRRAGQPPAVNADDLDNWLSRRGMK